MIRRISLAFTLSLALFLVGCEDGEFDAPDSGGGTQEVVLELTTAEPLTAGNPFTVRATVTDDGNPAAGIPVAFTAVNASSEDKFISPNPVQTALILGTADTTVNTAATDRTITVTATAATASDSLTVTLQAR
jgi:hypothetical protein